MKLHRYLTLILVTLMPMLSVCQQEVANSIHNELILTSDSFKIVDYYNRLAMLFYESHVDSTFIYAKKARTISHRLNYKKGTADAFNNLGVFFDVKGDPEIAFNYYHDANLMYKELKDSSNMVQTAMNIGGVYYLIGKNKIGLGYLNEALRLGRYLTNDSIASLALANYVLIKEDSLSVDSVNIYLSRASAIAHKYKDVRVVQQIEQLRATNIIRQGYTDSGIQLLKQTAEKTLALKLYFVSMDMLLAIGDFYADTLPDTALAYYQQALTITIQRHFNSYKKITLKKLYSFYNKIHQADSAFAYSQQLLDVYEAQDIKLAESEVDYIQYAIKEQQLESATRLSSSKTKIISLTTLASLLAAVIAMIIWLNRRKLLQSNKLLKLQFQQLESTTHALEESNQNYSRIVKIVAHDLRNPLSNIFSLSKMMIDFGELDEQNREFAELIHHQSNHSISQISDLLNTDLGPAEEKIEKTPVNINQALAELTQLITLKAKEKQQQIVLKADVVPVIHADQNKLSRVVNNLLVNAIKFSPSGSAIELSLSKEKNHILVAVKDSGIGIPAKNASTLFDPFTKGKRKGTNGEETFGLGLYISKKIVEAHQGTIWFESEEGKGSTFFIRLPATI